MPQVLLYVVGLPLGALLVLFRHRRDLHDTHTQFRWGILYAGYRDELYWWEITIVIRKITMVMVGGVFASRLGPDMQIYLSLALVRLLFLFLSNVTCLTNNVFCVTGCCLCRRPLDNATVQ